VRKSGSWYSLGDERIGQGRDNAVAFLADHVEAENRLRVDILTQHEIGMPMASNEAAEG
jgi:recombination protein RecA